MNGWDTKATEAACRTHGRYDEGKGEIPKGQDICLTFRGGDTLHRRIRGKYFFNMDEGYFNMVDPHGFGVVERYERGLLGRIEISAASTVDTTAA